MPSFAYCGAAVESRANANPRQQILSKNFAATRSSLQLLTAADNTSSAIPVKRKKHMLQSSRILMKDEETIARFIHLRAQCLSFARIATELNVSKPTLINWGRQFQFEIQNLRSVETEALAEKRFTSGKVENAARFPEETLVRAAVQKYQLHDVELYYLFWEDGTSQFDFTIPLR